MKANFILTSACVAALAAMCCISVMSPIRFENEQAKREAAVKQRLLKIRTAEERYKAKAGTYTGSFKELVGKGFLADSLQYIPYSEGRKFELSATTQISKSGRTVPLMECGAPYEAYLEGLDQEAIAGLVEKANDSGGYPGLKIGDITQAGDIAGNWE